MIEAPELAQHLDAAYAAYKRKVGRQQAIERLQHMLARDEEAQRILIADKERNGTPFPRAAE